MYVQFTVARDGGLWRPVTGRQCQVGLACAPVRLPRTWIWGFVLDLCKASELTALKVREDRQHPQALPASETTGTVYRAVGLPKTVGADSRETKVGLTSRDACRAQCRI